MPRCGDAPCVPTPCTTTSTLSALDIAIVCGTMIVPAARRRPDVEAERVVGLGKARVEPVGEHVARAADAFLGRLADQHERAGPRRLARGELPRGADERGHVHVVAARVHHGLLDAGDVDLPHGRRVRQAALLLDGQAVHVGAQQHGRARAVAHDGDDAVPPTPSVTS